MRLQDGHSRIRTRRSDGKVERWAPHTMCAASRCYTLTERVMVCSLLCGGACGRGTAVRQIGAQQKGGTQRGAATRIPEARSPMAQRTHKRTTRQDSSALDLGVTQLACAS